MKAALSRPLNISFVIPYFYPAWKYGGQPRSAYELARALVKRGHHVKVLTTDSAGDSRLPQGRRSVDGIEAIYYRNVSNRLAFRQRMFWPPSMFRDLDRELTNSDILHIHELRSILTVPAYNVATKLKLPYVLSAHGGLRRLGKTTIKTVFDALWGRRILRDAAAVIAVSPIEASQAISMNVKSERIHILPNAISIGDYETLPERGLFRRRWHLGSDKTILFLGRLHWIKGADLLVRAFAQLRKDDADIRLVIAGSDDGQEGTLRELIRNMSLHASVTFTGFLDHQAKLEALVDADLLVVPSRSEVFAINVLEALMCACPVLLSDACGLFPMPQPEHGVRLFKSEIIEDLANTAYKALDDRVLRVAAGMGRQFVSREFGEEKIGACAESIYRQLA